ncbi:MAG TPA: hypothetical protein VFA91_15775, partial [Candidatus Polarisedimenticolia bacterium]|nr:hypothetical protein [Candidatus Polarisedimenticolia bacterium]
QARHEKSRLDIETLQNTLISKPGFRKRFHHRLREIAASQLFSPARCAILVPSAAFVTDDTGKCLQVPPPAPKWKSN